MESSEGAVAIAYALCSSGCKAACQRCLRGFVIVRAAQFHLQITFLSQKLLVKSACTALSLCVLQTHFYSRQPLPVFSSA